MLQTAGGCCKQSQITDRSCKNNYSWSRLCLGWIILPFNLCTQREASVNYRVIKTDICVSNPSPGLHCLWAAAWSEPRRGRPSRSEPPRSSSPSQWTSRPSCPPPWPGSPRSRGDGWWRRRTPSSRTPRALWRSPPAGAWWSRWTGGRLSRSPESQREGSHEAFILANQNSHHL